MNVEAKEEEKVKEDSKEVVEVQVKEEQQRDDVKETTFDDAI